MKTNEKNNQKKTAGFCWLDSIDYDQNRKEERAAVNPCYGWIACDDYTGGKILEICND